jgi:hypothetical protein
VLQVWGNVALFSAFGFDWLGTKPILADPTFVAGFGHWRVTRAEFVPVFVALMPLLGLWGLLLTTGTALLIGKLWGGQGTFEQLVTTGICHSYRHHDRRRQRMALWCSDQSDQRAFHRWVAAMSGEWGRPRHDPNRTCLGVFRRQWAWQIARQSAIRRVRRSGWAAVVMMLVTFAPRCSSSLFVR